MKKVGGRLLLLSLVVVNVRVWADSSTGPALIAVAHAFTICAPASSSTVWLAPLTKDGTSFTGLIVSPMVKVPEL